jgi:two-component system NarL family sensor kinase
MKQMNANLRWGTIILAFIVIAILDFATPSEYIWAYLYVVPILFSVSFLKPTISKILLLLAVFSTLLNLFYPEIIYGITSITINRLLATFSIVVSTYFMVRYINHQAQVEEQRRLVENERNLSRIREDFVATLTHDLKTPLLGEQSVLQHLTQGTFGTLDPEHLKTLEALNRNKKRQLELVDSLLSVYRNDTIGVELQSKWIDIDELIADTVLDAQSMANERQLELSYQCERRLPTFRGDSLQLRRVITNLLHNALNYTPSGGHIQVFLSQQTQQLLIQVCDDGPGLKTDELETVFHRFYRAAGTRDTVGTGLGLYLSRQIIEAHRGRLWVQNRPSGGCEFNILLPVSSDEERFTTDPEKGKLG